jgi:hypothetical protein
MLYYQASGLPVNIPVLDFVLPASVGGSLADIELDTEVWSWGKGSNGQLGHGDQLDRYVTSSMHNDTIPCGETSTPAPQ